MKHWPALTYTNLVQTYVELANAISGTETEIGANWVLCRNPIGHASCNFGILSSVESIESASVHEFTQYRDKFHLYSFCSDQQSTMDDRWAARMGFRHGSVLIALALQPQESAKETKVQLRFAETQIERHQIAEMIAQQFFPRQTPSDRNIIVLATSGSNLPLAQIIYDGRTVGAIMLCRTESAIGVYNFFIEERFRGLGIGTQCMLEVVEIARSENRLVCLQCDLSLLDWYESKGFVVVGHVDIWALDQFGSVAIIG